MYEKLPQEVKDYPYMKLRNEVISLENSLREVEDTIKSIESQQVTKDNLFRFILE